MCTDPYFYEIYSLTDYRHRYAQYKLDRDLKLAHASTPFVMSFDDHEVDNSWADAQSEHAGVPPEVFMLRRAAAFQAWYEHMPVRKAQLPLGPSIAMYRQLAFGDLLSLNVLDTRQYRTDQPCNDGVKRACEGVDDPRATMLGARQERWLFDNLAASRARWNVLGQQVMVMRRRFGPDGDQISMDKWDAYSAAQRRLHDFLAERKPANPIVLTGDVHNAWVGDLKADYDRPAAPGIGVEFSATSISSNGNGRDRRADYDAVMRNNPHIKFFNDHRGYTAFDVTPARWLAHHRIVERVTEPGAPLAQRQSFAVEAGTATAVTA